MHLKPKVNLLVSVPLPPFPLHRAGRVNQSCLTAGMWFHLVCGNTIPVRSKRSIHCDRDRVTGTGGAILEWHRVAPTWHQSGTAYTTHIRKY